MNVGYDKGMEDGSFFTAWFGDLKDGVHTGGPEDPRMKLIEIKAKCEFFWSDV